MMEFVITRHNNGRRKMLTLERTDGGPCPLLIDRISINGCRYIASPEYFVMKRVCEVLDLPTAWLRWSEEHGKWYLRLWGRFKKK